MDDIKILSKIKNSENIVIWGAGFHTEEIIQIYGDIFEGIKLTIIDKNKAGQKIVGMEIQSIDSVCFSNVDLVIVMTGIYMEEIVLQLRQEFHYEKDVIGLYEFRQQLAAINGNIACRYHMNQFIDLMESGTQSYSYDSIFRSKFSQYRVIKVYAYWFSSIGEGIRHLFPYYYREFLKRKEDEYCLLMPFVKGNDFANGSFIEILSREIPMVTAENCHFWKYVMEKYEEKFDFACYNNVNGILVDAYNPKDRMMDHEVMYGRKVNLLKFNKNEEAYGKTELKRMGIDKDFVCIFARDSAYLCQQYNQAYTGNDMRDMNVQDFETAVEYLETQNIQAVRMGKIVSGRCELKNCIDYANINHEDFLDLYLISRCKFFVGSHSGIGVIANLQNKPVLVLGLTQFGTWHSLVYHDEDMYIPKKIFDKNRNRFLTFWEMLDVEMAAGVQMATYYEEHDLIFIDPTKEEIRSAIREMNEKIDKTYQRSYEAECLIQRYFSIWNKWLKARGYSEFFFCTKFRICESYLLNNQFLLEM